MQFLRKNAEFGKLLTPKTDVFQAKTPSNCYISIQLI